jgi:secondary thiamine-phosphate synthase enzyme
MVRTAGIELKTKGNADVNDITQQVKEAIRESDIQDGVVTIFTPSSTSGLTTIEFESGAISDFQRFFDEIINPKRNYAHNARWGDGNGHSHIRASLLGPSISVPFKNKNLMLGTWQQIIFVDFDIRSRQRHIVLQMVGE